MYEFEFLRTIQEQLKIYQEFPLPAVICSADWRVYGSNYLARQYYDHMTNTQGLQQALAEFDLDKLYGEVVKTGNCTVQEVIPFSSVNLSISPIFQDGEVIGMVLLLMRMDNIIDVKNFYQRTKMPTALSDCIRDVADEVFSILDRTAHKSDILNAGWIKSGLNAVAYNNYRILRVASNITEFVRYQSELLNLSLSPVNLTDFLRDIGGTVSLLAETMEIPFRMTLPGEDIFVQLDRDRFEIALYNVLHNSFYYTRTGNEVELKLSGGKKGGTATVRITDKGLGIPAGVLPDVTRPYFYHDHGKVVNGMGLGLAIARLAAGAHGGTLRITSKEGDGTSVRMIFPVDRTVRSVPLEQSVARTSVPDRFSHAYTGIADAAISHHNPMRQAEESPFPPDIPGR